MGPGHHGDDEYEYEIHHFEKFHNEDTTEEELTHPEDIEHVWASFLFRLDLSTDRANLGWVVFILVSEA